MAQFVDWNAIRLLAIQGVPLRQLAREFAVPAGTVMRKASQEKWGIAQIHGRGQRRYYKAPAPLAKAQQAAADQSLKAVSNIIESNSVKTRVGLSNATAKAAGHLESLPPAQLLDNHAALHSVAKTAAQVFDWNSVPEKTRVSVVTHILMHLTPEELSALVETHPNWDQKDWESFAAQRFPHLFREAQSSLMH